MHCCALLGEGGLMLAALAMCRLPHILPLMLCRSAAVLHCTAPTYTLIADVIAVLQQPILRCGLSGRWCPIATAAVTKCAWPLWLPGQPPWPAAALQALNRTEHQACIVSEAVLAVLATLGTTHACQHPSVSGACAGPVAGVCQPM